MSTEEEVRLSVRAMRNVEMQLENIKEARLADTAVRGALDGLVGTGPTYRPQLFQKAFPNDASRPHVVGIMVLK